MVLPQPEGPTTETNSHGPISSDTFWSALTCISWLPPNSRETESRRRPTAWPRRSLKSSGSTTGASTRIAWFTGGLQLGQHGDGDDLRLGDRRRRGHLGTVFGPVLGPVSVHIAVSPAGS